MDLFRDGLQFGWSWPPALLMLALALLTLGSREETALKVFLSTEDPRRGTRWVRS